MVGQRWTAVKGSGDSRPEAPRQALRVRRRRSVGASGLPVGVVGWGYYPEKTWIFTKMFTFLLRAARARACGAAQARAQLQLRPSYTVLVIR
jgi:hypothetical protein